MAFVGLVAFFAWLLTGFGCTGDVTKPWPPVGSAREDFCRHVDYGLVALLAARAPSSAAWRPSGDAHGCWHSSVCRSGSRSPSPRSC